MGDTSAQEMAAYIIIGWFLGKLIAVLLVFGIAIAQSDMSNNIATDGRSFTEGMYDKIIDMHFYLLELFWGQMWLVVIFYASALLIYVRGAYLLMNTTKKRRRRY